MSKSISSEIRFWRIFPNTVIGVLSVGLILTGVSMLLWPTTYRSFYLDVSLLTFTPTWAGVLSIICAAICLTTRACYVGVALVAATFAGRGALLFTAWAMARVDPPPPASRWIWEAVNMGIVLHTAGHIVRSPR